MTKQTLNRILHVDDEPDIREVARLALEAVGGFTVESCASGARAVATAPDFQPDMILLDVMMPDMDGPSTLRALRDLPATSETPVLFMTAKAQTREVEALKELGAIEVVVKPFDPMTLAEQIRQIWQTHVA